MNILFITPEVLPFARAGGLGDVSHYLPRALRQLGHRLWIITPKYRATDQVPHEINRRPGAIKVPLSWRERTAEIHTTKVEKDIEVIFVECDDLFNRAGLYGNEFGDYEDNAERFIFFSRAALEVIKELDIKPDIIHCHEWPTGLVPVYAKTLYRDLPNLDRAATVFTFHNLGSQGLFWHYDFTMTGLGWELFTPEGLEFHGQLNMMKAGLVWADVISTVSRKYASEALTPEYAFGLEGVLQVRKDDTFAVLNGVDYEVWDPATDQDIAANYFPDNLAAKKKCRNDLAQAFTLNEDEHPIVAVISRLLDRKGFDILSAGINDILSLDLKLVFMGMGEDKYHSLLHDLSRDHPGRVGIKVAYDKALAHRIMAGADMFLMPSRYEPCGLEQLYALKYGTVPVVRATGGLDDTVIDVTIHKDKGTGFKFTDYTPHALLRTLETALASFNDKSAWEGIMRRGMSCDFSWSRAATEYEKIYIAARKKIGGA